MGRELKRVALNFQWPLGKVWSGFQNPHYEGHCTKCPDCNGTGSTPASQRLQDLVSLIMLSGSDALEGRCHPYFVRMEGLYRSDGVVPSKDMAELTAGLAGRAPSFMGHDCRDKWSATRKIIEAAGLKKSWGECKRCKGNGSVWDSPASKRRADRWREKQPPKGPGYQIWETVSEGSPISPVFATPEELADWMTTPGNGWQTDQGTTREQWLRFINGPGWAPTMVAVDGKLTTGVQADG